MARSKAIIAPMVSKKAPKAKEVTKRKRRAPESFRSYIHKIMKQVHPQSKISKKGMMIVNNLVTDTFERIASEASKLCRATKRSTLSTRDVQSACSLVLPGELSKHAVAEGTKAMGKFAQA